MSLKRMPSVGKSLMSRILARRAATSMAGILIDCCRAAQHPRAEDERRNAPMMLPVAVPSDRLRRGHGPPEAQLLDRRREVVTHRLVELGPLRVVHPVGA